MRKELSDKYSHLCASLRGEKKLAVAFSAGVDSTLLLQTAVNALGNEKCARGHCAVSVLPGEGGR